MILISRNPQNTHCSSSVHLPVRHSADIWIVSPFVSSSWHKKRPTPDVGPVYSSNRYFNTSPCRVMHRSRRYIPDRRMTALEVVGMDVLPEKFGWMPFSVAMTFSSFSPFRTSRTRSDLNFAEKFLLVRDINESSMCGMFQEYQIH